MILRARVVVNGLRQRADVRAIAVDVDDAVRQADEVVQESVPSSPLIGGLCVSAVANFAHETEREFAHGR